MLLSDFHYDLPESLIARHPAEPRSASRLLHLDGATGALADRQTTDLPGLLRAGDLLVFNDLASQATLFLAGGSWRTSPATVGTVCDPSALENWGDPYSPSGPCGAYRPIVYVAGDLDLPPGRGQGILLVEGRLMLHGPYDFAGLVMVRGGLDVASGDSAVRLNGAVFAGSVGAQTTPPAVLSITYSKCLLSKALLSSGQLVPLRTRSWKALF